MGEKIISNSSFYGFAQIVRIDQKFALQNARRVHISFKLKRPLSHLEFALLRPYYDYQLKSSISINQLLFSVLYFVN